MAKEIETPANAGSSIIKSFRYFDNLCFVTLVNGVSGIIGNAASMPLRDMLTLKGQSISYEHTGTSTSKGKTFDRYRIAIALEED